MKIWICYVFVLMEISLGDMMKTYTDGGWQSDGDSSPQIMLNGGNYMPNQSSLATTFTSFQQVPKSISPLTQQFSYENKPPMDLDAIPHEYIRTILKPYPVYINVKSEPALAEAGSHIWPLEMFAYMNSFESGENAGQIAQLNHLTHLSAAMPTDSSSSSNAGQTQTSYPPMAPFEQTQTFVKPYHTSLPAVKRTDQQMNSIGPMQSVSPVTTYNPLFSAMSYAHMPSVAPFEHYQTFVRPYPIYFKEEQHSPTYVVEQPPSSPPPSNFWHPETFAYNKPTFTYHNFPDSYYSLFHSEAPIHSVNSVHPFNNMFKQYPVYIKEKHPPTPPRILYPSNYWSTKAEEGGSLNKSKGFVKHKNFLIKRKSTFHQR